VWLVKGVDASFTALLNHALPRSIEDGDRDEVLRRLFAVLLNKAGVEGGAELDLSKAHGFRGEYVTLRYGEADILALLADPRRDQKTEKLTLRLDKKRFAYDLRAGKRLRRSRKIRVSLARGDAFAVAALPYEVTELVLTTLDTVRTGRRLPIRIAIKTRDGSPGDHLVHVTFNRGLALPIPYYAQDVACAHGEGETYIPLALDEAAGIYTVAARDVLTGVTAQTLVAIEGGPR
jgi:hypothetical protein